MARRWMKQLSNLYLSAKEQKAAANKEVIDKMTDLAENAGIMVPVTALPR